MSSERDIESEFRANWRRVDELKKKSKRLWFININPSPGSNGSTPITTKEPDRTTFAFDYVAGDLSGEEVRKIRLLIGKFRGVKWNRMGNATRARKLLDQLVTVIEKHPSTQGTFV